MVTRIATASANQALVTRMLEQQQRVNDLQQQAEALFAHLRERHLAHRYWSTCSLVNDENISIGVPMLNVIAETKALSNGWRALAHANPMAATTATGASTLNN